MRLVAWVYPECMSVCKEKFLIIIIYFMVVISQNLMSFTIPYLNLCICMIYKIELNSLSMISKKTVKHYLNCIDLSHCNCFLFALNFIPQRFRISKIFFQFIDTLGIITNLQSGL